MAIWLNEDSKILVQGMTGSEGTKHTRRMRRTLMSELITEEAPGLAPLSRDPKEEEILVDCI